MDEIIATHTEKIVEKKKKKPRKLNESKNKKKLINLTNQANEELHVTAEGGSDVGSAAVSMLEESSLEDRAANDTIEKKTTAFKDEPVLELSKGDQVLTDEVKENSHNKAKKRKRKSKRKGVSENEPEPMDQEHKDLDITNNGKSCITDEAGMGVDAVSLVVESPKVDIVLTDIVQGESQQDQRKTCKITSGVKNKLLEISVESSCISAAAPDVKGVDLIVEPVLQESAEIENVSTEIVKEKQNPEGKKRRKKKSRATNKGVNTVINEEDKCQKISVDSKTYISADEPDINGVCSTVKSLLQESSKVGGVSTELAKEVKIPELKQKRKKKSKAKNKDEKEILHEEGQCLKASVTSKSCIAAAELGNNDVDSTIEPLLQESPNYEEASTEIVKKQETAEEKQRKRKSKDMDEDEKMILGVEDKCLKISGMSKSSISAAEPSINGVGSVIESLLQDSLKVEEVSTEIAKPEKIPERKQKRKKKSKAKNKDGKAILDDEGKCLKASVNSKSCIAAAELGNNGVDSTLEPLLQESPNYELASTEIVKKQETPEEKQRKRKSKDMDENEKVILGVEDKCPKISVDSKSCISADESGINGLGSTGESLLQETLKVGRVSIDIAKEVKIPEGKRKRKKKSKAKDKDGMDGVLDEEGKGLKASVNKKSCIAAAELGNNGVDSTVEPLLQESPKVEEASTKIAKKQETPEEKQRRKRKSKDMDEDEKMILGAEDKSPKICGETKSCISSAELGINGVGSKSLLQDSLKVEEVSTEIAKEEKIPEGKRRSKKKSKAKNKDGKAILEEGKCLKTSVDSKNCILADEFCNNGVGTTVESLTQESLKVGGVSTEIAKEEKIPEGKRTRKKKSKARNKDGEVIPNEEVKRLKFSVDGKSSVAAAESIINDVDSTVESQLQESPKVEEEKVPEGKRKRKKKSKATKKDGEVIASEEVKRLKVSVHEKSSVAAADSSINGVDSAVESQLQESPKVEEVSTEIAKKQKTPEEKQRSKRKSKDTDRDQKVILGEEDKCLKVEEVSTEIAKKQKIPEGKQRTKRRSKNMDKDEKVILGEDDDCLKVFDDRKSCVPAAVSTIKNVDLNVESLHQDSAVVGEASAEIVIEKKSADGEESLIERLKSSSEKKVEVLIRRDQQDELLVTSIDGKCCTKTEMGTLQGVDSRTNGNVDLPNDLCELPQIPLTPRARRILLILDINGLLADLVMPPPKDRKSDINMLGRAIFKRPYCDDFLDFCFDTFDVGIWSSRTKRVIDKVVDYLLGRRKEKLLFCWDMSHTTVSRFKTLDNRHKPLVCKSLSNVWEKRDPTLPWEKGDYTESNTLLIDDSPYKALLNPMHTAIFPYSFTYKDPYDNTLGPGGELREYLENLAKTDDVRRYVEQHPFGQPALTENSPSWDFYSKVVHSLTRF